ncbi:hypothetical protein B5X24_HaOG204059 [Helicoverpa armigera]|uniref:Cyclic nucleotide-binding domain-containing protein n=1 Tax=Helicoverpa armigera TaxID=29058 RepID=A0A2W1BT53_HELAM|nr:hypothetical protein B5X24_HaOG204059 [Helicoverpa armigera]
MDPEEIMRPVGRMVMANCYWLIEAADQYEGVEDVKRRVAQAVRGKAKKKRLLNINDKALLNKPNCDRTDTEKKYIYRIIGGLKCFKRYPNHVKKKLAAVTYFKYYGPNRVIVRQHHDASALYFIVTGDVTVSQMIFDELLQQYVSVDIGIMHPGDMFGEVSLLHNIPRTATCTTVGHCELLALMKEDFKNVLQASVQKQSSSMTKRDSIQIIPEERVAPDVPAAGSNASPAVPETIPEENAEEASDDRRQSVKSEVLMHPSEQHRESVRFSVQHPPLKLNIKTYFMQVCKFYPGSTFGFGENMRDRRIVAVTPVDCMLMPKMWLLQRNTANIWSRIQHFLEKKIPTKRQLFQSFVSERRWQEFRDQLVGDIVARSNTINWTSLHDVPYSIRMEEMVDI